MQFGKQRTTKTLDDEGSTETREEVFVDGKVKKPVTIEYAYNVRVRNELEEIAEFHAFSKQYHSDPTMLRPAFEVKYSGLGNKNGYYYVVKRFEREEL